MPLIPYQVETLIARSPRANIVLDWIDAFRSGDHVAYWAHVGGTVASFSVGFALLKAGLLTVGDYDNRPALDYFTGREPQG